MLQNMLLYKNTLCETPHVNITSCDCEPPGVNPTALQGDTTTKHHQHYHHYQYNHHQYHHHQYEYHHYYYYRHDYHHHQTRRYDGSAAATAAAGSRFEAHGEARNIDDHWNDINWQQSASGGVWGAGNPAQPLPLS